MNKVNRKKLSAGFSIGCFIIVIIAIWEIVAKNPMTGAKWKMIFVPLEEIAGALIHSFTNEYAGVIFWRYVANSLIILLTGLVIGVLLAFVFSSLSVVSKPFWHIYVFIVNMFDLLPGIAILPIAIMILGVNKNVIIILVVHSVIWPMSHSILTGFETTPKMYIESAQNMEMRGAALLFNVYIPASMHYVISGLKVGWARAWRGLISAEMIFGIVSTPGIGMYINIMRTNMKNAELYSCLFVILLIGALVQYGLLIPVERMITRKWGI